MRARIVPPATGAALLLALVALACQGTLLAGAALVVAALSTALVSFGVERLGAGFLVLALLTAPMNSVRPSSSASFVTMSDLLFVVGAALLAPRLLRGRLWLPTKYVVGAFLLLTVGVVSSVVAADHPALSLNLLGRLVAASMVLPVVFMLWAPSARMVDVLAGAYVVGQTLSVLYAVVAGPADNGRYEGLTVHPNFFAMCAITAIALLLHLLHRVPRVWRWLLFVAIAVNAYGAVLSGSRMGLGLLVVLAIAYPLIERSALSMYAVATLGVTSLLVANAVLVHAGAGSALNRLQGDATASTSDSIRADQLHTAFAAIRHSPVIGNGFENALDAQNIYLQVAVSAGILGLIGFLLMFAAIIEPLFQRGPMHRLGYAAFAYAVGGLLTASLWDRMVWAGLSLSLLAATWSPARAGSGPPQEDQPPAGRRLDVRTPSPTMEPR
jgi:O-antigen ligase